MRKMKKLASLLLAMIMVFAMSATAFAAEDTYSITINNSKTGHTYEAYQIFTGDLSIENETKVHSNIAWGSGITDAGKSALLQFGKEAGETPFASAAKLAETLTDTNAVAFANEAAKYLNTVAGTLTFSENKYVISGLTAGYYLVKDKNDSLDGVNDSYTNYIIKVVGDATASPKGSIPTVVKKVQEDDKNVEGSTDGRISNYNLGNKYNDVADYNIGEAVPFKLIGTLPSNYEDYTTYKYIFHDTLSKGLEYNGDAKVYVDNGNGLVEILKEGNFVVSTEKAENKETELTITFADLKDVVGEGVAITKDSKIVVMYTAELTTEAVIGLEGNENKVRLEFSNNPYADGSGDTGKTPEDKVIVLTNELDVEKIHKEQNGDATTITKLQGAEFKLLNSAKTQAANVVGGKFVEWVAVDKGTVLISDDKGKFIIQGLDDGTYYLEETKAPTGYNLLEAPIELTITATTINNQTWNGTPSAALTALSISVGDETKSGDTASGIVNIAVENNKGAILPSTGGMGTTLFYVAGFAMMITAAGAFVVRRRMTF